LDFFICGLLQGSSKTARWLGKIKATSYLAAIIAVVGTNPFELGYGRGVSSWQIGNQEHFSIFG
jgi:hypothetical protein